MMTSRAIQRWRWVHTWSSLISTVFLLLLCITGLPLIFHEEIDHALHEVAQPESQPPDAKKADLDAVVREAMARHADKVVQFLFWDEHDKGVAYVIAGDTLQADFNKSLTIRIDEYTGRYLDAPAQDAKLTYYLFRLHTDLFAGLPGKLFLGLMGILFVAAVVSGIVLYGPSMSKMRFGEVRTERVRRVRWLDLHNLIGGVTLAWMLVVGTTGVINTWADLMLKIWQFGQLAEMTRSYQGAPVPTKLSSVESAVQTARQRIPNMEPSIVAYPGTAFSSTAHYAVFMRGDTQVTSRLLKPALIDAATGGFTDARDMPWFVQTLFLSQPLHFGDYGGLPLKLIWAGFTIGTIVVLITGLYLWWKKRSADDRFAEYASATP